MSRSQPDPFTVLGSRDPQQVREWLHGRPVTPGEVEAAALQHYPWRQHLHEEGSYWVTVVDAAALLGVSPSSVRRMLRRGELPCRRHRSGARLIKRSHVLSRLPRRRAAAPATAPAFRSPARRG